MFFKTAAIAAAIAMAGAAQAATFAATSYSATGHSLYIFDDNHIGYQTDYHFNPAGVFTIDNVVAPTNGSLSGRVQSESDANSGFDVSVTFDVNFASPPQYKQEQGAAPTPADNVFLNLASGTLTGFGTLSGHVYDITRRPSAGPYATQIGTGSNAKNANDYGLASWIWVTAQDTNNCLFCTGSTTTMRGDFNLKLGPLPPPGQVPLPAGAWLLLSGLCAAGALRMRKGRSRQTI